MDFSFLTPLFTPEGLGSLAIALGYGTFGALEAKAKQEDFSKALFLKTILFMAVTVYLTATQSTPNIQGTVTMLGANAGFMWALDTITNKIIRLASTVRFTLPISTAQKLLPDRTKSQYPAGTIITQTITIPGEPGKTEEVKVQ